MKMSLRWYGPDYDKIPLEHIKQIPNVDGVISTLFNLKPNEIWTLEQINNLKKQIEDKDLELYGIESLNVSEDIKAATNLRDEHISNYIESLTNLGKAGIKMVCYNFMPVFDWTRTDLYKKNKDGSLSLVFNQEIVDNQDALSLFNKMSLETNGIVVPNLEKQENIKNTMALYQDIDDNKLFDNLIYFLKAIMPTCDKYDINMAIHPDDPAWPIMNIPRIIINKENIKKVLDTVDNKHNGLTFCTGSLASSTNNDIIDMLNTFKDRIHFVHIRNIRHISDKHFEETSHYSNDGELDIYKILKTLYDNNYQGIIRPDHGRTIFNEDAYPGYGLYDRALGATYLNGIIEAIEKSNNEN